MSYFSIQPSCLQQEYDLIVNHLKSANENTLLGKIWQIAGNLDTNKKIATKAYAVLVMTARVKTHGFNRGM